MPEPNGGSNANKRLEDLEAMDKLLLRAQVLQQDMIEKAQANIERHEKWLRDVEEREAKERAEARIREQRLDERIEKLVSGIGEFIRESREARGAPPLRLPGSS